MKGMLSKLVDDKNAGRTANIVDKKNQDSERAGEAGTMGQF